jgi:homoserine kinase
VPDEWQWVVCYPGTVLDTKLARSVLPDKVATNTAIEFAGRLAKFTAGLLSNDPKLAIEQITDVIAEPYRKKLINNYSEIKSDLPSIGAKAVGISGAGPTLFALCDSPSISEKVRYWLEQNYVANSKGFSVICKTNKAGAVVTV